MSLDFLPMFTTAVNTMLSSADKNDPVQKKNFINNLKSVTLLALKCDKKNCMI